VIVLGVDTALDACSVAIVDAGEVARDAAAQAGVTFANIDRIVVTKGPGSFTGVRVGLSFARALALALNKPCLGVPTLEALALQQGEEGLRAGLIETPGAAYFALYENGAPLVAPQAIERGGHEALLAAAAQGRSFAINSTGETADAAALARRGAALDPELYPPAPLYLRAPHVTLPKL
jgi:tRNA threonylcarbamoyladenosine biosynthesis protein TsaB